MSISNKKLTLLIKNIGFQDIPVTLVGSSGQQAHKYSCLTESA